MTDTTTVAAESALTPLTAERHAGLRWRRLRAESPLAHGAAPLLAEEFAAAQAHHPIVFSREQPVEAVALTRPGERSETPAYAYRPLWLRRRPFALARDPSDPSRRVLCADLGAPAFDCGADEGEPLFDQGAPSAALQGVLELCARFDAAAQRSRAALDMIAALDLLEDAEVELSRDGRPTARIRGFRVVSETRLRALDDATLADLARRGVIALIAAHHFSLARLAGFSGKEQP